MRYPTIDQYVDALSDAQRFTKSLCGITLVYDGVGQPVYSSGNFGVVFSAISSSGEPVALKCFTRHQWGRREAYERLIAKLPCSPYFVGMEYLVDEIEVAPYGSDFMVSFDVLLMERVMGRTFGEVFWAAIDSGDLLTVEKLAYNFDTMALWLLSQPIAHGDIKPDNIMVSENCSLTLIDYDGFYLEDMEAELQREFGTEGFQHPLRGSAFFDRNLDDYSLAAMSLSLRVAVRDLDSYIHFSRGVSDLIFDPYEAVMAESATIAYLRECEVVDIGLLDAVCSSSPTIVGLSAVISRSRGEMRLAAGEELRAIRVGAKWGFATLSGEVVVEASYDAVRGYVAGLAAVRVGDKWGFVDFKGRVRVRARFDRVWDYSEYEGLAMVCSRGRYGYIDRRGRVVIAVIQEYAMPFSEGYAVVCCDGLFGYMDVRGEWVELPRFQSARSVRGGIAEVSLQGSRYRFAIGVAQV